MTPELASAIQENRQALESFLSRARGFAGDAWHEAPALGKWSPAQITEHIALAYEVSTQVIDGKGVMPAVPRLLRPLLRFLFLKRMIRTGKFPPNAKAPPVFEPSERPPAPDVLEARVRAGCRGFEEALERTGREKIDHPVFGAIGVADYVRFGAVHTRHHEAQFPGAA